MSDGDTNDARARSLRSQDSLHLPLYGCILHDNRWLLPDRIQSEVAKPVYLAFVQQFPVEVPDHLGEDDSALHIPHILADAATRTHGERFESIAVV